MIIETTNYPDSFQDQEVKENFCSSQSTSSLNFFTIVYILDMDFFYLSVDLLQESTPQILPKHVNTVHETVKLKSG